MTQTEQPLRVLYISDRPGERPRIVEQQPNEERLAFMQSLVEGLIELVPNEHGVDIYANEEGLYNPEFQRNGLLNLIVRGYTHPEIPIMGPGIITGHDGKGNTTSVPQSFIDEWFFPEILDPDVWTSTQVRFARMFPMAEA